CPLVSILSYKWFARTGRVPGRPGKAVFAPGGWGRLSGTGQRLSR
ncbi:MAG: hypothetical protein AVDCRST_MAG56-7449, partial [uncultured Cytophagales bacterium]